MQHSPECARSVHIRLDDAGAAALDIVRAEGVTDSEAVRMALREAATRRRSREVLRAEAARVVGDAADPAEMRVIREQNGRACARHGRVEDPWGVVRLPAPSRSRRHEQGGARYAVVVQADER